MIPAIGIMIGFYIITRCLSTATNRVENWVTIAFAYITILVALVGMVVLASGSQHVGV